MNTTMSADWPAIAREATGYLQQLLRIDTTNPPGNERAATQFLQTLLEREGIACTVREAAPGRTNLVARLDATGARDGGPLLLSSHLDVVATEAAHWTHPPFAGVIADGYLWGRGALDMKSKTIMDLMAMLLAKREGWPLRRVLLMAALADEEMGCGLGSQFLVERHPDLIRAEYCLNELGGFTTHVGGRRFYPIQVAEKGIVWLKMTVRGTPGHGSRPHHDMALEKLGRALVQLTRRRLPLHVTPPAQAFLTAIAAALPAPQRWVLRGLVHPAWGPLLHRLLPLNGATAYFLAITHNTACPTSVQGGTIASGNVIPSEVACQLDGRIVPGYTADDLRRELHALLGEACTFEVVCYRAGTIHRHDTPLFAIIKDVVEVADPGARAIPMLLSGMTDAHFYHQLGTITYGFQPLRCAPDYDAATMPHAHDERIPVAGFHWGVQTYAEVVRRFCG